MTAAKPKLDPVNRVSPQPATQTDGRSLEKGDVPIQLLDRYLIERDRQGRPERYYRDNKAADPMFRDHGRALSSQQAYPDTIASMLRIAQHRGWSGIKVSGDDAFRREVWVQGRALGLDVSGYKPTERDRQAANEPADRAGRRATEPTHEEVKRRLDMASVVVRTLISDPVAQARLLQKAWARVRHEKSSGPEGRDARQRVERIRQR